MAKLKQLASKGGFAESVKQIVEYAQQFWSVDQFPHFTEHGLPHSERIIEKIDEWLSNSQFALNSKESFVLLGAIYLHDIGMCCKDRDLLQKVAHVTPTEFKPVYSLETLGKIRNVHAELSWQMIQEIGNLPKFKVAEYAQLLEPMAKIARAHCGDEESIDSLPGLLQAHGTEIRVKLLAALMRVGDALDATTSRINWKYALPAWESFSPEDKFHVLKHQYVSNVKIKPGGEIQFYYIIPDSEKLVLPFVAICAESSLRLHCKGHVAALLREANVQIHDVNLPIREDGNPPYHFRLTAQVHHLFITKAIASMEQLNKNIVDHLTELGFNRIEYKNQFRIDVFESIDESKRSMIALPNTKSSALKREISDPKEMLNRVDKAIGGLVETILRFRDAEFLFSSNAGGSARSITVSAIVLRAFDSLKRPESGRLRESILRNVLKSGPDKGAWTSENGIQSHVVCTSWALFSCLKSAPEKTDELAPTVSWLLNERPDRSGGWGFVRNKNANVFYTAVVLNALIEFVRCKKANGEKPTKELIKAVEGGIDFIFSKKNELENRYLWRLDDDKNDFCIASTSWSIHVLNKYNKFGNKQYDVRPTIEFLCSVMENIPEPGFIHIQGQTDARMQTWPTIVENGPTFWYRYFTPIVVMTLFRTSLGEIPIQESYRPITNATHWILDRLKWEDKDVYVNVGGDISLRALWVSAQSIMILSRWRNAYAVVLGNGSRKADK